MSRSQTATAGTMTAADAANPQATRETVESIVVAIILAFLFRAFVAEAFVIPTGSMAPTLQGRHLDLKCEQCGYQYRTGASLENEHEGLVKYPRCPICRYEAELDRTDSRSWFQTNKDSFNGDRILVSKFAYELSDPKRWDVIVFKYPGNAKQNYIKRLIGLPGETVWIQNGDIFIAHPGQEDLAAEDRLYEIARKPPSKVKSMLQLIDDTRYIGPLLSEANWPSRWLDELEAWKAEPNSVRFSVTPTEEVAWLRYRHLAPRPEDWISIESNGELLSDVGTTYQGQLVTDYYAYNDYGNSPGEASDFGSCWVGDLSVDVEANIQSDSGEVWLELVEGGIHFRCRFDIASGQAELSIEDGAIPFTDAAGNTVANPTAQTAVGTGRHRLQLANIDDQLLLWVDSKLVEFESPTTYVGDDNPIPAWEPGDSGDLMPLAVGARNASVEVTRMRVWRDVYYQAVISTDHPHRRSEYLMRLGNIEDLRRLFSTPSLWADHDAFQERRSVHFALEEDQFFPLGDNSPQSKDARLWSDYGTPPHYVKRELLLGKALIIYWPHRWRPFLPNFTRMGLIR